MKEIIRNFLNTKSNKEFHSLNILIRGNGKVKTREQVVQMKKMLMDMKEFEFVGLEQLDVVNSMGHNPSYPDGRAMPTQYHNFDSVGISARGLKEGMSSIESPLVAVPQPRLVPREIPIVQGHPLDLPEPDSSQRLAANKVLQDALISGERVEVLSEQLGKNGLE